MSEINWDFIYQQLLRERQVTFVKGWTTEELNALEGEVKILSVFSEVYRDNMYDFACNANEAAQRCAGKDIFPPEYIERMRKWRDLYKR